MEGYDSSTYGRAFADVYDDWYRGISDVEATVDLIVELGGDTGSVLELGVGTGRLAVPIAARGLAVTGVDSSPEMLARLRAADPGGTVRLIAGDMIDDLPDEQFDIALIAYNTLFNLPSAGDQQRCFDAIAERLRSGGSAVIEAFVPDEPFRRGDRVEIRSMTADQVVLSVARYDDGAQQAAGHFVELTHGAPVQLRPWFIRYSTVRQLDAMADRAGLRLADRWEDAARTPFHDASPQHVSVYRRI